MNLNNLEDRKQEMKNLGFSEKLIERMEENIKKGESEFKLYESAPATKGQVDLTLYFRQSKQSDFYYLNRYEALHNQSKPLDEGQRYLVITKGDDGKNRSKGLDNLSEAIDYFKKQLGDRELAVGKDAAHKTTLVSMEDEKINFIAPDFKRSYFSPPLPQTFWIDRGKGIPKDQGVNLVQGRAIYRDNLMSREGVPYKAWMQLDTERPRDRMNNLMYKQYGDPGYRFDLKSVLETYNIKELSDPKEFEKLDTALRQGNRPLITVIKEGKPVKLHIETAVRWGKINFFAENGKPEKREQFLKESSLQKQNDFKNQQGHSQFNEHSASQTIGR
jgi:hypothetical protein